MKKLNLAMIATALMFSFGCQKENLTPNDSKSPSSASEDVNITMKCTPGTTTFKWDPVSAPTPYNYGPVQTSAIVIPGSPDAACFPNIFVTADFGIFSQLWDMVVSGATTLEIRDHIGYNWSEFMQYIDPCILDEIMNGNYTLQMHNFTTQNSVEYMMVYDGLHLLYVYELFYN